MFSLLNINSCLLFRIEANSTIDSVLLSRPTTHNYSHICPRVKMASHKHVDIPTYDGLKLKGTLFSVGQKKPCIIMSSGVSHAEARDPTIY
jgi:hypothetical protein